MGGDYGDLDDDLKPKSKGPLIAIIVAVLAVGLGGAYYMTTSDGDDSETETQGGPAKVIKAGDVPPDTQGPKGAKGAGVDSIEGSRFKEGSRPSGGSHSGGGGGSKKKKKKADSKTKIVETDDPLAGIDGG